VAAGSGRRRVSSSEKGEKSCVRKSNTSIHAPLGGKESSPRSRGKKSAMKQGNGDGATWLGTTVSLYFQELWGH